MNELLIYYVAFGAMIFSALFAKKNNFDKEKTKIIIVTVSLLSLTLLLAVGL